MRELEKLKRLPPYVFTEVNRIKDAARAKGSDIIDFGMGNPDIPTPKHIVDKLVETLFLIKGGYALEKPASEIKLSNIFHAVNEEIKTLNCKKDSKKGCNNKLIKCNAHFLWDKLDQHINSFFEKTLLEDLINKKVK